jgi:hypothetical protein
MSFYTASVTSGVVPGNNQFGRFAVITLKNVGTYILSGQVTLINTASSPAFADCYVLNAAGELQAPGSPAASATIPPFDGTTYPKATLSENGYWVTSTPNTSLWIECSVETDTYVLMQENGSFTAIQVR